MIKRTLAKLPVMAALVACEPTATTPVARGPVDVGSTPLSLSQAATFWTNICVETQPTFRAAPEALAARGFVQNPSTGTYFHQQLDLSFKLIGTGRDTLCSMVFVSIETPSVLGITLASGSTAGGEIGIDRASGATTTNTRTGEMLFRPGTVQDGKTFYRAVMGRSL